jgi:hypothetical protein
MRSYSYIRPGEEFDPESEGLAPDLMQRLIDRGAIEIVEEDDG